MGKKKTTVDLETELHAAAAAEIQPNGKFEGTSLGWLLNKGLRNLLDGNTIELDAETAKRLQNAMTGEHAGRSVQWIIQEAVKLFLSPRRTEGAEYLGLFEIRNLCQKLIAEIDNNTNQEDRS